MPKVGTLVRDDRQLIRKPRRYRRAKREGEFATDARAGMDPSVEATTEVVPAEDDVAERLQVPTGTALTRTVYRFLADGRPTQTSTSYELHDTIAGTPIAVPEEGPLAGTGVITRYDSIGIRIDHVTEEVSMRPPRGSEGIELDIPPAVQVFVIRRTFSAHSKPVETADIVIPGERYALFYSFAVTDEDEDPSTT